MYRSYNICSLLFLPPQQDLEKLRLTEEKLRTKTNEDSKTIEELADQLSKAKLEIDGLKALCNILPDFLFSPKLHVGFKRMAPL